MSIINIKLENANGTLEVNEMFSAYDCSNVLTYATTPTRANDFSLNNEDTSSLEIAYIPTVSFVFNSITADMYTKFIQIVNSRGFTIYYYDYELQQVVRRRMYMTEKSLNSLYNKGRDIRRLIGVNFTFVSIYGYDSYADLKERATTDERF